MSSHMKRLLLVGALGLCLTVAVVESQVALPSSESTATGQAAAPAAPMRWYKGNTHTHTLNSDGDSTPDEEHRDWNRERSLRRSSGATSTPRPASCSKTFRPHHGTSP